MSITVYKLGGPALEDPTLVGPLAADLRRQEGRLAVVHGGGRHVDKMLKALNLESRRIEGRRETSAEAMDVVEMVLSGLVNKALAAGLTRAGVPAAGISGRDAGLLAAQPEPGLGRVGTQVTVLPGLLEALWSAGYLPVLSPVSGGPDGGALNVNADEAALGVARSLGAGTLVYFSDADGVKVEGAALHRLDAEEAKRLIADGTIHSGMALKVRVALQAAEQGIDVVIAGKARLLGEFAGTRIVASKGVQA